MMIRLAQPTDASALACLNAEFNASTVSPEQVADYLVHCPDNDITVVAETDGHVVGFACLRIYQSWCYSILWSEITELYVESTYRRKGFGRGMVNFLEKATQAAGGSEIMLFTNKHNREAQSLYRQCGYREQADCVFRKALNP